MKRRYQMSHLFTVLILCGAATSVVEAERIRVGDQEYLRFDRRVNQFSASSQEQASLAVDAQGRIVVTWDSRRQENGQYGVYARRLDSAGRPLADEFKANVHTPSAQRFPGVALRSDGGISLVWTSMFQDGDGQGVFRRDFSGDFEAEAVESCVYGQRVGNQSEAAIANLDDGRSMVVWTGPAAGEPEGRRRRVYSRHFDANGAPTGPSFLVSQSAVGSESTPAMAASGDEFWIVWSASDSDQPPTSIRAARFDGSGARIGDEVVIADKTYAIEPAVACDDQGGCLVAWLQASSQGYEVMARRVDSRAMTMGHTFAVGAEHRGFQSGVAAAKSEDGREIIVWNRLSEAGKPAGVFAQLFESETGDKISGTFRLTSVDSGKQALAVATGRSRVSFGPEGQIIAAWSGDAGLGDKSGVHVTLLIPARARVVGDVNQDSEVNSGDVAALARHCVTPPAEVSAWAAADLNGDGEIDGGDLEIFKSSLALTANGTQALSEADRIRLETAVVIHQERRRSEKRLQAIADAEQVQRSNLSAKPHEPPKRDPNHVVLDPFGGDPDPHHGFGPDPGFIGVVDTGWTPPDPHMAVGPEHVVVMTNGAIAALTKDGTLIFQDEIEDSFGFWGELGTTGFVFDPEVIYDPHSERFMAMACERTNIFGFGDSFFLLAISDDSNPDGVWFKYRFDVTALGGGGDIDSPNMAVDDQVLYLSADFFQGGEKYLLYMLEKEPLLSGSVGLTNDSLITGSQSHGMPVIYGDAPAMYLIEHFEQNQNTTVRLTAITDPLGSPVLEQMTLDVDLYRPPEDPPQAGTTSRPETFDARFWSCVWRNGSLWATHHVNVNPVVARWYEIRTNEWPASGTPEVVQSGNIDPGFPVRTFFSAITANDAGDAAIVFARSSPTEFISMARAVRAATDPLGTFRPVEILKESTSGYTAGRWGDYAGIAVDPADPKTFWAHHEYATGSNSWNTWVASFRAPCDGDANGDGIVDPLDSGFVTSRFGCDVGTGDTACDAADVNADGVVDPLDAGYVQARFGDCL